MKGNCMSIGKTSCCLSADGRSKVVGLVGGGGWYFYAWSGSRAAHTFIVFLEEQVGWKRDVL